MGTIRFELRKEAKYIDSKSPIRLIYQIKGQRKSIPTGLMVLPYCWDSKEQEAIYIEKKVAKKLAPRLSYEMFLTDKQAKEVNKKLSEIANDLTDIEKRFEANKQVYSADMVAAEYIKSKQPLTKKDETATFLYEFIDKYIGEHTSTREEGSLQTYRSLKRHLQDFQKHTKRKISFDKIDYAFFQSFQTFLITAVGTTTDRKGNIVSRTPLTNSTASKQLSTIKTFLNYAKKNGVQVNDKYKDFSIKREAMEVIALTNEEFESLFFLDLSNNKKLAHVRDVFCFGCVTGLRYSDLSQLRREHLKSDEIKLTVTKTKQPLSIPLTPFSRVILDKYKDQLKPLPVISNQKMNEYVKELCKKAGIVEPIEIVRFQGAKRIVNIYPKYELIGSHTGRKTFATLSLEKGMSAEQVMSIGGWKDYKSFKRYVNVTTQLKKTVMLKAWSADISELKLKAV